MQTLNKNFFELPTKRELCYYSFIENKNIDYNESFFPILYFHGFPGSGIEAQFCADSAFKAECQIFSFDRPGFGFSDPQNKEGDYINNFIDDVWEFVLYKKWSSFSIIGTSGGGPFCLAFLASYLKKPKEKRPRLEAIASLAGIYIPAGSDEMMPSNKKLFQMGDKAREKDSYMAWMRIRASFTSMYYFTYCPHWIFRKVAELSFGDTPQIDQDKILDGENLAIFIKMIYVSLRQGSSACVDELAALSCPKFEFEEVLKEYYNSKFHNVDDLPRVSLFHGDKDVNVPMGHSRYLHEVVFGKSSTLVEYPGYGHLSLIIDKSDEYIKAVIPAGQK